MPVRAGFAEAEISPPLGTLGLGRIEKIAIEAVLDPIFAGATAFECEGWAVGFIQLDTLCIRRLVSEHCAAAWSPSPPGPLPQGKRGVRWFIKSDLTASTKGAAYP